MLLLACLFFSTANASANWLAKLSRGLRGSTTGTVVAEIGAHAAEETVLTSLEAQALTLAPVPAAFDTDIVSLPSADLPPTDIPMGLTTAPDAGELLPNSFDMLQTPTSALESLPTYSPGDLVDLTAIPTVMPPSAPQLSQNAKRTLFQQLVNLRQQRKAQKAQKRERALAAAKQELPQLLPDQATIVSKGELLTKVPIVRPIDPPTTSLLFSPSKLAEAIEESNPTIPILPFMQEPGFAYRGMAVSPEDIATFFTPGVGIERRLTEASNRLNLSLAAGSRGAAVYFATHKVLNMTVVPQHAQLWGSKFLSPQKPILVVIRIKGDFENGYIINHDADILPQEIDSMAALLGEDGNPRWFDIRPLQDGTFQITPYELIYK